MLNSTYLICSPASGEGSNFRLCSGQLPPTFTPRLGTAKALKAVQCWGWVSLAQAVVMCS